LSALFDNEYPNGISSLLKRQGWSNKLIPDYQKRARGIVIFEIEVYLTENGVDHIYDIVKLIFQVIFHLFR